MRWPVADSTTVVTGASSGIGRATALALARRGGKLVLTARSEAALTDVVRECEAYGGHAVAQPLDIAEEGAADRLAARAFDAFGRLDSWINNAAVTSFGRLEVVPWATHERVLRTNLFGYVLGARAAVRHFRKAGRGLLINVASAVACFGQPETSAYVISKWGIRGLGECLRMELAEAPDIRVCTVLPGSVDTPIFQNAANYSGRGVKPLEPMLAPETVAHAIVGLYRRPRRELFVGRTAALAAWAHRMSPGLTEPLIGHIVERAHFDERPSPAGDGNLFMPRLDARSGGWRGRAAGSTAQ
jgi:short-subunit dehydrogenase